MTPAQNEDFEQLLREVRACTHCAAALPHGPRPVLQLDPRARILIASQAPGRRVHASGLPFDDASGDLLRRWLGLDRARFYDPALLAIVPMGLCYPGTGSAGDLPPRPECAPKWRARLLAALPRIELTLLVGRYAIAWHLQPPRSATLAAIVGDWRRHAPALLPLPHPSPRNRRWLAANPWFGEELLPVLAGRVREIAGAHRRTGA